MLLWALAFPAGAAAHANLLRTSPASGGVVARAPSQVLLHFDQQVRPVANGTTVVNEQNQVVSSGTAHTSSADVRTLVVPLQSNLPDGDYTVRWSIVSTDGHLISGVFAFGVGAGRPPPQAVAASGTKQDYTYLTARYLYFAGLLLLVGGAVFRLAVFRPGTSGVSGDARRMLRLRENHRATQLLTISAGLALAGGWVALTLQGAAVAGVSFWEAFDHRGPVASALQATRFGREFGRGIDVTAVFTVLVAVCYALAARRPRLALALAVPAALTGLWALAAPGISGHAGDPGRGVLAELLDAMHMAAAAIWIGGLAQIVWVVPHATRGLPEAERDRTRTAIITRFSAIALGSVIVLAASGLGRALFEFSSVSQIWTTSYGQTLIVKSLLLGVVVVIAARNRRMLDRFRDVRRSVIAELVLLAGALAAATLLTNLPPASSSGISQATAAAAPRGGPVVLDLKGGARFAAWPGKAGTNGFSVQLPAGGFGGTPVLLLQSGGWTKTVPLPQSETGRGLDYAALVPDVPAGRLTAQIDLGNRTLAATVQVGQASAVPGIPPQPLPTGATAAAEAGDLAVAVQRIGKRQATVTVLNQTGAALRDGLINATFGVAVPCTNTVNVCFRIPVPAQATHLDVGVQRVGKPKVTARIDLPAASARSAATLVEGTVEVTHQLDSLVGVQNLASDPIHSVHTTFVEQNPDRIALSVRGGVQTVIIGNKRWDKNPGGDWVESPAVPGRVPDPFWGENPTAAYYAGGNDRTVQVTLATTSSGTPVFFRLFVDRATGRVLELHMTTAAHFMVETYGRFNSAPPVEPPVPTG